MATHIELTMASGDQTGPLYVTHDCAVVSPFGGCQGGSRVFCQERHWDVRETPAEITAKFEAAEREAKFEERVHARAEALYSLWIREEVDDPSHEAAYHEAIVFVTKGQRMIDAHIAATQRAKTATDSTEVAP